MGTTQPSGVGTTQPSGVGTTQPSVETTQPTSTLPSLQTPTNLALGFMAGLDPSKSVEARLEANILLVEEMTTLARAVTPEGNIWLGQARLDALRRISVEFKEVIVRGQRIPIQGVTYNAALSTRQNCR